MPHKKKQRKTNIHQRKQEEAEKRNAFLAFMKHIMQASGCGQAYDMLPANIKTVLYSCRINSLKIRRENCQCLNTETFKCMSDLLDKECREIRIPINKEKGCITLKQFYTIGISLLLLQEWMLDKPFPKAEEVRTLMLEKLDLFNAEAYAKEELKKLAVHISFRFNQLKKHLIWIGFTINPGSESSKKRGLEFNISARQSEVRMFTLNGNPRPAFRLGLLIENKQILWMRVDRSLLNKQHFGNQQSIPVYIQSHALNRINERLDTFDSNMAQCHLYFTFDNPRISWFKGNYLIEYIYSKKKLGYLVASIVNNVLLVKTFLLLTHEGTPEGEKLKELSGLTKIDMQYWAIDRLSTFLLSDISKNEELRKLFEEAGCNPLFEVDHHIVRNNGKQILLAMDMLNYIHVEPA